MARRVDVDASLPPLVVPGRILNELFSHALETLRGSTSPIRVAIRGTAARPSG